MGLEENAALLKNNIRNYILLCVDNNISQLAKYKADLETAYNILCASSYEEALAIITCTMPDLILLDVSPDKINGFQILDIITNNNSYANIPIIALSEYDDIEITKEAFLRGAADFIRKPYNTDELILRINHQIAQIEKNRNFENYCEEINAKVSENIVKLREAKNTTVIALTEIAGSRDNETGSHLKRIKKYVLYGCEALSCSSRYKSIMTEEYIEDMYLMSALHDIGKVGISDSILKKPGKLTSEEFTEMKKHTIIGGKILKKAYENNTDNQYLALARDIALYHHEKWGGGGYPEGLSGEKIPLSARIVTLADVFDALSTHRIYKQAYERETVLSIMNMERMVTFDPYLYDIFMRIIDKLFKVTNLFES